MYDAQITIRKGEKLPEFATIPAFGSINFTISAATFQLLTADHTAVNNTASGGTNFSSPVTATSFDVAAAATPKAWYVLIAADTNLLVVGSYYIGRFVITESGSDSIARTKIVEVQIVVIW